MATTVQDVETEWEFINHYIQVQRTWWTTFSEPTKREDIQEDRKWARDVAGLVSALTKYDVAQTYLKQEEANYEIKLYTWQKHLSKYKIGKQRLKVTKYLREYTLLKQRFVKEHKQLA